jgi:hypothetical protein
MEDNLLRLRNRRYLCVARASIGLGKRQDRFSGAANRLGNRFETSNFCVVLIRHRVLEGSRIGRRLWLSENRFVRVGSCLGCTFWAK